MGSVGGRSDQRRLLPLHDGHPAEPAVGSGVRQRDVHAPVERGVVLDWLLEPGQPSMRYLALTQLLGKSETDSDVKQAKARITSAGWAAEMLARRDPAGWWVRDAHPMSPKYVAMNWNLLALSDLGATRATPEVRASCELWMEKSPLNGGGVGGMSNGHGHHCYTGNMTRSLIRMGYGDDRPGRKALDWLGLTAHPKGGWTCWNYKNAPATRRALASWEGLSAFPPYPPP